MSDAIGRAIDAAEAQEDAGPPIGPMVVPVIGEAIEIPLGGGIKFNQLEAHAQSPRVLLLDVNAQAWRPLLLTVGHWHLTSVEPEQPPAPRIWTP